MGQPIGTQCRRKDSWQSQLDDGETGGSRLPKWRQHVTEVMGRGSWLSEVTAMGRRGGQRGRRHPAHLQDVHTQGIHHGGRKLPVIGGHVGEEVDDGLRVLREVGPKVV